MCYTYKGIKKIKCFLPLWYNGIILVMQVQLFNKPFQRKYFKKFMILQGFSWYSWYCLKRLPSLPVVRDILPEIVYSFKEAQVIVEFPFFSHNNPQCFTPSNVSMLNMLPGYEPCNMHFSNKEQFLCEHLKEPNQISNEQNSLVHISKTYTFRWSFCQYAILSMHINLQNRI